MSEVQHDINSQLVRSTEAGDLAGVKAALAAGADVGKVALKRLLSSPERDQQIAIMQELLEHGADPTAEENKALRWAVFWNCANSARLLLKHGADVHSNDNASLRMAVRNGNVEIVALLLEHGADVRAEENEALRDATRETKAAELVPLLLEHGADPRACEDQAFLNAAFHGRSDILDLLVAHIFHPERWDGKTTADMSATLGEIAHHLRNGVATLKSGSQKQLWPEDAEWSIDYIEAQAFLHYHQARRQRALANPLAPQPPQPPRLL